MFAYYPPLHNNYIYTPYQPRFYNPIPRHRNESYYAPTTPMYNIIADPYEQRRRAQEAVQQKQRRRERENQARQHAYRQWAHEQEAKRDAMKKAFERHSYPNDNDINLNKFVPPTSPRIRRIPIQSGSSNGNRYTRKEAAKRIVRFIRHHRANSITRHILRKLRELRIIEQQLGNLDKQSISSLTLSFDDEHGKQVLPNTPDNKRFIGYEEAILKILDQLDRIDSNGLEVIRERRKHIVMIAQKMLGELDLIKNEQWSRFNKKDNKEIDGNFLKCEEKSSSVDNEDIENLSPTQNIQNKIERSESQTELKELSLNDHESNDQNEDTLTIKPNIETKTSIDTKSDTTGVENEVPFSESMETVTEKVKEVSLENNVNNSIVDKPNL
ncbi:5879_t:CDS:2 [Ambispora leptoticha]|uniref:5879_t:CDS:1 n=1 Tax=Ambispora leptoticha TaxID=144679 RepID=A0A9N9FPJ7_9GLOM|nr:5879_t:CDS:2 [Ambispora leptoticha]